MVAEFAAAFEGLKVASTIAKGIANLKTETEINLAIIDLQQHLVQTQQFVLKAQSSIRNLEDRLAQFETWETEKERYELKEVVLGGFVYATKEPIDSGDPPHWICPQCYQDRKKSILQTVHRMSSGGTTTCHRCDLRLTGTEPPSLHT